METYLGNVEFLLLYQGTALNMALAVLCGALIGSERQVRQRMAGLRTNALVALGSACFVIFQVFADEVSPTRVGAQGASGAHNGWILLLVAFLQVFSYPVHDPVMMDRGFLADPNTTRKSFLHAFWISSFCIIAFGFFGIQAHIWPGLVMKGS